MKTIPILKTRKNYLTYILFLCISLFTFNVSAQTVTAFRQINLLKNNEIIETIMFVRTDPELAVGEITATLKDSDEAKNIIALRIFNPLGNDEVIEVSEGTLKAETDTDFKETFAIKGLNHGTATVSFMVNGTSSVENDININVNVIGVEAQFTAEPIEGTLEGTLPSLDVIFTNNSETFNEEETTWKWDFGDGTDCEDDDDCDKRTPKPHMYEKAGIFNASLKMTTITDIGNITIGTSTVIVVQPETIKNIGIVFADEEGNISDDNEIIITKSIDVLINKEVIETVTILKNGNTLLDEELTIAAKPIDDKIKLILLNQNDDENDEIPNGGFTTQPDTNGQINFAVLGIQDGFTGIEFSIIDSETTLTKTIDVNVLNIAVELAAIKEGDCTANAETVPDDELISGPSKLRVMFRDDSQLKDSSGTSISKENSKSSWNLGKEKGEERKKDFTNEDGSCIEVEFEDEGAHQVTRTIEIDNFSIEESEEENGADTRSIKLEASVIVFVKPGDDTGTLFGKVFDSNIKQPIAGAVVQLDGEDITRIIRGDFRNPQLTDLDGGYRFEALNADTAYSLTICAGKAYGCETKTINVSPGPNIEDFNLTKLTNETQ